MIRNQFNLNNQQQRQIYSSQQANGATEFGAPPVDMSHLTLEERAMIQSVMAKAEMVNNSNNPRAGTNMQTQMVGQAMGLPQQQQQFQQQNIQCQPNMQQMQLMGGPNQQLRQFDPMIQAGGPNRMQTNPALYNAQQQSLAFLPGGPQMNQQVDNSRSQLPALERRTQDLVNQINNQFNLNCDQTGPTNAGDQPQRSMNPQPAGVMTAVTRQTNQQQLNAVHPHGVQGPVPINPQQHSLMAMQNLPMQNQAQNFPHSNAIEQQQVLNANQLVAQCGNIQMQPAFNLQNQPNFLMNTPRGGPAQNFQQMNSAPTNPVGMLPSQTSLDARFVSPFEQQNQMMAQQQQQHQVFHNPRAYGFLATDSNLTPGARTQLVADERQNIVFRHGKHVLSDQENRDQRSRAIRRNRSARWSRFNSLELADEDPDEDREGASRWRHEPAAPRRAPKRPGQSRCNQTVVLEPGGGCSSDRARQRRTGRHATSNPAPSSSESSLSDESISSAASNDAGQKLSRPDERRRLPRLGKHESRAPGPAGGGRTETSTSKASKLMSELKLSDQASQMMEQQQLLIKQSQELIKLQQAQLEQQSKRPQPQPPPPDECLPSSVPVAKSDTPTSSRQVQAKCVESNEIRDAHLTDSSIDSDQADWRRAPAREPRPQIKHCSKLTRDECLITESPSNTTGSDSELLTRHSKVRSRQRNRRATPTRKRAANRESSSRSVAGFTPSPLPVEAAIELHHLKALHNSEAARGRSGGCSQQRGARSRVELLRSRSVCNSPQGPLMGRLINANSPDCHLGEFAQRLAQRKLLPDPPANAVPLTPLMVRKLVETQRLAATSSSKLPTSVNAQSTSLTNYHSFRQPCLDQRPSSVAPSGHSLVGYQCDQLNKSLKLAPKSLGSYTARIDGAQVSFAQDPCSSSAAVARHQRLSALSRADLSKFLDFTNNNSILKISPQRLPRTSEGTGLRPLEEQCRLSTGRPPGPDPPSYEPLSYSERRLRAYRDDRLSSRLISDRDRRSSEGDDNFGYDRSRFSIAPKHVNFEKNNLNQATRTSYHYSPSLSSSMPNRLRSSHLSDLRLLSSPQRHESSSQLALENRLSRYRTHCSSIDEARFSTDRPQWSPRPSWAANPLTTSDRLLSRYNTSRLAYSDYEPTSYARSSRIRDLNSRRPYKQRSFDNC